MNTLPTFTDSDTTPYAELPVKPAFLRWTRGNAQLRALAKDDPAAYLGGWRAMVNDSEGNARPALPLPIVDRVSGDGKLTYKVYATNVLHFLPIQHRTRFEFRATEKDPATGRDKTVIKSISRSKQPGYAPSKQVFGLVFNGEEKAPAVLVLDKWSSFITYNKASDKWAKLQIAPGLALVRSYGTVGKDGMPIFEEYGQSLSTPIEAIDVKNPRLIEITDELVQLFNESLAWKNCQRWNAEGEVNEPAVESAMQKFLKRAEELGLSSLDIEQIVAENKGDYVAALKSIEAGVLADLNAELESADQIY
jgi:hypothetical protein